ncbi:RidA family protein [Chitinasiproducens palmae]|uniref:Reactive intermediate/imine deaminase n=1 Tax=Chitinasiproducens palmae TaxID=1770053 RepID=A0A1H2PU07_9BURK|nr:RidA family protein [Chitinasiproducens palmae]SDV50630.1 reactive intermediate/imine deaminase [Chitinasiproducens palmae]
MAGDAPPQLPAHPAVAGLSGPGGHYSHVTVANGFVFISGQLPITADGVRLAESAFPQQVAQVLGNLQHALDAAGSGIDRLVQVRVYLDDIANWPMFDEIYARWAGSAKPSRAVVPTGPLHFGLKIEIEAVAVR